MFLELFIPRNIIASSNSQKPNIEYFKKVPNYNFYILGP